MVYKRGINAVVLTNRAIVGMKALSLARYAYCQYAIALAGAATQKRAQRREVASCRVRTVRVRRAAVGRAGGRGRAFAWCLL